MSGTVCTPVVFVHFVLHAANLAARGPNRSEWLVGLRATMDATLSAL
jgi:hypothetical protein